MKILSVPEEIFSAITADWMGITAMMNIAVYLNVGTTLREGDAPLERLVT